MLIPDYEIKDRASREIPDKGSRIIVYCRSGMRSAGTARALVKLGYTRVFDLGGIMHWPYETVRGTK
jgi:rhodanese-related sulfurtransferase